MCGPYSVSSAVNQSFLKVMCSEFLCFVVTAPLATAYSCSSLVRSYPFWSNILTTSFGGHANMLFIRSVQYGSVLNLLSVKCNRIHLFNFLDYFFSAGSRPFVNLSSAGMSSSTSSPSSNSGSSMGTSPSSSFSSDLSSASLSSSFSGACGSDVFLSVCTPSTTFSSTCSSSAGASA